MSKLLNIDSVVGLKDLDEETVVDLQIALNNNGYSLVVDGILGDKTIEKFVLFKADKHLAYPYLIGPTTAKKLLEVSENSLINREFLEYIFLPNYRKNIQEYLPHFQKILPKYKIDNPERLSAFFAQVLHESLYLEYSEELGTNFSTYEYRKTLGNDQEGDGKKFKGRGIIQITGKYNYRKFGNLLNIDLEANPNLAAIPQYSVEIACLFWNYNKLNHYADLKDLRKITRIINGGYNGWSQRLAIYNKSLSYFAQKK